MGDTTRIFWIDHTWNAWWGCNEVSEGCDNCYARTWTNFTRGSGYCGPPGSNSLLVTGEDNWKSPIRWNSKAAANVTHWTKNWLPSVRGGQRRMVFCASMSDVFEFNPAMDLVRERLWTIDRADALSRLAAADQVTHEYQAHAAQRMATQPAAERLARRQRRAVEVGRAAHRRLARSASRRPLPECRATARTIESGAVASSGELGHYWW